MKKEMIYFLIFTITLISCSRKFELPTVVIDSVDYITYTSAIAMCNVTDDGGGFVNVKGVCWSEKPSPTIEDNHSDRGFQGIGKYSSPLYNLKPETKYYVRAFAKNVRGIAYSKEKIIKTPKPEYITDTRDGQKYPVVKIGNQYWMAQNLNYFTKEGSWYYNNDSISYSKFGRLYNWYTACNVCPDGWRLPTREDWNELIKYINNNSFTGFGDSICKNLNSYKLKLPGTDFWYYEKGFVTNETGFSAVAGGEYVIQNNIFNYIMENALYWTSSEYNNDEAYFIYMDSFDNNICQKYGNKGSGLSVRCIKN